MKTFLDFSRPVEVKFEEVDLAALAREVADLMTPQARLAQIALDFEAADTLPALIRGDAGHAQTGDSQSGHQRARRLIMQGTHIADDTTYATANVSSNVTAGVVADLVQGGELRLRVTHSGDAVPGGRRQRSRHSPGAARQGLSAVLHHQAERLRNRFGHDVSGRAVA